MKNTVMIGGCLLVVAVLASAFASIDRPLKHKTANDRVTKFLTDAADARLMDTEEGKLARERGTTEEIRSYGRWMMRDQSTLLKEIKEIAQKKSIVLPAKISEEKAEGLEDLKKEKGKNFDKKFMKMIAVDHKRDVREFKKATHFEDAETKKFAAQYLPTIESHLERIKEIEKDEKEK
jgi:putative membrane protein